MGIDVILWRGCHRSNPELELLQMVRNGTAGGEFLNVNISRPSEEGSLHQVGEKTFGELTEYSTNPTVSSGFGRGSYVVATSINTKYLTKGSGVEGGWVCNNAAPARVLAWTVGEDMGKENYPPQHSYDSNVTVDSRLRVINQANQQYRNLHPQTESLHSKRVTHLDDPMQT